MKWIAQRPRVQLPLTVRVALGPGSGHRRPVRRRLTPHAHPVAQLVYLPPPGWLAFGLLYHVCGHT